MNLLRQIYRFFVPHPVRVGQVWRDGVGKPNPFVSDPDHWEVIAVRDGFVQYRRKHSKINRSESVRGFRIMRTLVSNQ